MNTPFARVEPDYTVVIGRCDVAAATVKGLAYAKDGKNILGEVTRSGIGLASMQAYTDQALQYTDPSYIGADRSLMLLGFAAYDLTPWEEALASALGDTDLVNAAISWRSQLRNGTTLAQWWGWQWDAMEFGRGPLRLVTAGAVRPPNRRRY